MTQSVHTYVSEASWNSPAGKLHRVWVRPPPSISYMAYYAWYSAGHTKV